jgi:hypothetical protein
VVSRPGLRTIGVTAFLVALLCVGAFIWSRAAGVSRAARDFPDGITMVCTGESCGAAFTATVREIAKIREVDDDAPVPCPDCAGPSVRARVCPECGASSPSSRFRGTGERPACPKCGKELPKVTQPE